MGGREPGTITRAFSNGGCALGNYIRHISPVVSSQKQSLSHRNADQLPSATVHGRPLSLFVPLRSQLPCGGGVALLCRSADDVTQSVVRGPPGVRLRRTSKAYFSLHIL